MFVGAISETVRTYLGNVAPRCFDGKQVVIGCSGNFSLESVISEVAKPAAIHSNDVSFYSGLAGNWLLGAEMPFEVQDPEFVWLAEHMTGLAERLASVMVLMDMLQYEKQDNAHKVRMWGVYRQSFAALVAQTVERLSRVNIRLSSYCSGDVVNHFRRFENDQDAVFCCYSPTYAGGYERLYKRLDQIVTWDAPTYRVLDDERRDDLLAWMRTRKYLWFDDRRLPGMEPVFMQSSALRKTVYLYSNAVEFPAYISMRMERCLPKMPLAPSDLTIGPGSTVRLQQISTTELGGFKDAYLGKNIRWVSGTWAFAVMVDGFVVGFLEFSPSKFARDEVYMMADFAAPGTPYPRLSKLMVMLAVSGETRMLLERLTELRKRLLVTTAFTERPVSMKYRGILELVKRGQSEDGRKYLNYEGAFNSSTWQEALSEWLTKHGSKK